MTSVAEIGSGAREGARDRFFGKYPGRVLKNDPPEDAEHRGELLVEIPGIFEEAPDGSGAQALQAVAKPCFLPGFFFIPDVDAQVWVEFVAGDINFPVWTGVWYPTDASPKTATDASPTQFQKVVRTSSGHVIQLDDTEGEEQVIVHHKSQSVIAIDQDGNLRIEHKGGAVIELKDDTVVEITADTVTVTGEVTLDGDVHITGTTDIEGDLLVNGDLTVGQGPSTTISGNEITGG